MGGQTFSVDSLVGELVKAQELNISDSEDDRLATVRGKNLARTNLPTRMSRH
jgi:hypothetical protein